MSRVPALRVEAISRVFPGVCALDRVSFFAQPGEVVALVGANGAGKSTLMNILGGVIRKSDGRIFLAEKEVELSTPIDSIRHGIGFVSQELNSLPTMTISENIFADGMPTTGPIVNYHRANAMAAELMARLGFKGDVTTKLDKLSTGDCQLVEIARALHRKPNVLIFDEPTSSLSRNERVRLFDVVASIKSDGVAVIYITHFLEEIFRVCDRVCVLRNGRTVFESRVTETDPHQIVHEMMGEVERNERLTAVDRIFPTKCLTVNRLYRGHQLGDLSFELRRGEIVGLWGLLGSGRTELLRAMVGLDAVDHIEMQWHEDDGNVKDITPDALRSRTGFVTEDRRGEGLLLSQSIAENIALPNLETLTTYLGIVDETKRDAVAAQMIASLDIATSGSDQCAANLSGGNQQKVVFARWLARKPKLFLLDEPTRGLDVKAKTEILRIVRELSDDGSTVLIASSELEELMRICDRYLIMSRGRIVDEYSANATRKCLLEAVSQPDPSTMNREAEHAFFA